MPREMDVGATMNTQTQFVAKFPAYPSATGTLKSQHSQHHWPAIFRQ